jgi:hypothetical protein
MFCKDSSDLYDSFGIIIPVANEAGQVLNDALGYNAKLKKEWRQSLPMSHCS